MWPLDFEHHRFRSNCAAAASAGDSGVGPEAAAHAGIVTL